MTDKDRTIIKRGETSSSGWVRNGSKIKFRCDECGNGFKIDLRYTDIDEDGNVGIGSVCCVCDQITWATLEDWEEDDG